jgi:DNA modification methylase
MILTDNTNYEEDCLTFMKGVPDETYNLIYTDVPYNMGSEYYIDTITGHYRFKGSGSDFMGKWEAFDGLWWNEWFKQGFRIIKQGGYLITHNIDRQADMWSYYARRNRFFPTQKLYWLFIDNFPKGVDVGLQLDKLQGVEREIIGTAKGAQSESTGKYGSWGKTSIFNKGSANKDQKMVHHNYLKGKMSIYDKTVATSEIAKKYDGYKYGQAPLKQVMEEILVFQKPYFDDQLTVPRAILNNEHLHRNSRPSRYHPSIVNIRKTSVRPTRQNGRSDSDNARWTPQLILDERIYPYMIDNMKIEDVADLVEPMAKVNFLPEELIPYNFCRKPNVAEREMGLESLKAKTVQEEGIESKRKNTHPTPKPLALCKWVLSLFAIPDIETMKVYDPFSGQGSIPVACEQLGIKWNGTEINKEYTEISKLKLDYYRDKKEEEPKFL